MRFKRKIKANVILSFVTTLLILSVIDLSFIPQTNSKFKTAGGPGEDGIALEYQVGLYPLYKEGKTYTDSQINVVSKDTTNLTFDIEFTFPRQDQNVVADVDGVNIFDVYSVTSSAVVGNQACTVTSVNGTNGQSVSLGTHSGTEELVTVRLHCGSNVKPTASSPVSFEINVYENIDKNIGGTVTSERRFKYTNYKFVINEVYYNDLLEIVTWKNPLVQQTKDATQDTYYENDAELYANFTAWMNYYIEHNQYGSYIRKYIYNTNNLNSAVAIKNTTIMNNVKGLKMSYSSKNKSYTFTIEENLVGYALTADSNYRYLYFYGTSESELENVFDYYLSKIYDSENAKTIKEYIDNRGGIKAIFDGKRILGITYDSNYRRMYLTDDLLLYATSLKSPNSRMIKFDDSIWMQIEFERAISTITIISDSLKGSDSDNGDLQNEIGVSNVTKNNKSLAPKSFIDYYVIWDEDNNYYILVKIWSDYELDSTHDYNLYDFEILKVPDNMEVIMENVDEDTLNIDVLMSEGTSEEEAREDIFDNILIDLQQYFGDSLSEDYVFENRDGQWVATFTVSKGYASLIPPVTANDNPDEDVPSNDNTIIDDSNDDEDQTLGEEETNTAAVLNTQNAQTSINKVTDVVDATVNSGNEEDKSSDIEVVEENDILISEAKEAEESSAMAMISSIMRFVLKK